MKNKAGRLITILLCAIIVFQTPVSAWAKTPEFESAEKYWIVGPGDNRAKELAKARKQLCKYNGKNKKVTIPSRFTIIGSNAFEDNKTMEVVVIPKTVTKIETQAFVRCKNLKQVVFEKGSKLKTIGEAAFDMCENLKEIQMPDSVTRLGDEIFGGCSKLENVKLPQNVTYIPNRMFEYCTSLKEIHIPKTVKSIKSEAFASCTNLKKIYFNNQLKTIGVSAFEGCKNIEQLDLCGNNLTIENRAFKDCNKLKAVQLPANVKCIEYHAFESCKNLEMVTTKGTTNQNGKGTIEKEAFTNCRNLKSVRIPGSIGILGKNIFDDDYKIDEIIIDNPNIQLEDISIFDMTPWLENKIDENKTVIVGGVLLNVGADIMDAYTQAMEETGFFAMDGVLLDSNKTGKIQIPERITKIGHITWRGTVTEIICPSSLKEIGDHAFKDQTKLNKITLNTGLKIIGDSAFQGCTKLKNIALNQELEKIGMSAFRGCTNLTQITLNEELKTIDTFAFSQCTNLKKIVFNKKLDTLGVRSFTECKKLTGTIDLSGVKKIGAQVFWRSSINKVVLGKNNVLINKGAFEGANIRTLIVPSSVNDVEYIYSTSWDCTIICKKNSKAHIVAEKSGNKYKFKNI